MHPDPDLTDPDNPEWTERDFARAKPAFEVMTPAERTAFPRTRGPQKGPVKTPTSIRLDRDVLDHFRARGPGWQTKINELLRAAMEREA